jgi:bifunctional non-homologous end joining protein LigD
MILPRPMKADDISDLFFEHDPNTSGSFFTKHDAYVIEPKIDGVRAFLSVKDGVTQVYVATSHSEVRHDLPQMNGLTDHFTSLLLDGELVIPGETLGTVVGALNATKRKPILDRAVFYAFDLLEFDGNRLSQEQLTARRTALEMIATLFPDGIVLIPQYEPSMELAEAIRNTGFEGFMLKRSDSLYHEKRHPSWLKVKWLRTIDCFVTDWQPGKGGYEGLVGALHMSVLDKYGRTVEIGKHGVFTEKLRREMTAEDGSLKHEWYGKVMELSYQDVGTNMRLRHPRLYRLRPDKAIIDCELDQLTGRNAHQGVQDARHVQL